MKYFKMIWKKINKNLKNMNKFENFCLQYKKYNNNLLIIKIYKNFKILNSLLF